jgi:hypothetical protein
MCLCIFFGRLVAVHPYVSQDVLWLHSSCGALSYCHNRMHCRPGNDLASIGSVGRINGSVYQSMHLMSDTRCTTEDLDWSAG